MLRIGDLANHENDCDIKPFRNDKIIFPLADVA